MSVPAVAAKARYRRLWWFACALTFVVTGGLQAYLAVSMAAWWAWTAAALLGLVAVVCAVAALRTRPDELSP